VLVGRTQIQDNLPANVSFDKHCYNWMDTVVEPLYATEGSQTLLDILGSELSSLLTRGNRRVSRVDVKLWSRQLFGLTSATEAAVVALAI